MVRWVLKSILLQRTNFLVSALGLGMALFLVIAFKAFWLGETNRTINYARRMNADIWVMQKGVLNMHMARSEVWSWKALRVAQVPGVRKVTPILYSGLLIKAKQRSSLAYAVGLRPDAQRAGPWKMHSGKTMPNAGEVVIPLVFQRILGVDLGELIVIADHHFRVVGFSDDTYSMVNSVVFLTYSDLQDLLTSIGSDSYFLVDIEPGQDSKHVAQNIEKIVGKVTALPQSELLGNEFEMVTMMGIEMIALMSSIGSALAVLILGFTVFTQAIRQKRELAIIKALGFRNRSVYSAVFLHTIILTMVGYLIALLLIFITVPTVTTLIPQVKMMLSSSMLLQTGLYAIFITFVASLLPAYIVNHVEPASAFKG